MAGLFEALEDRASLSDCLVLYRVYREVHRWEQPTRNFAVTTGPVQNKSVLQFVAAYVTNEVRRFNISVGLPGADDNLPVYFRDEPLELSGSVRVREDYHLMCAAQCRLRGRNPAGILIKPRA